jgi:diacylglycerol kinase
MKARLKSFSYALNGIVILFREEPNARIHLFAAISALTTAAVLKVSRIEWTAIVLVIGMVFTTEILNSAIENLADFVSPGKNELIGKVKDLSAAAVIVSALVAFVTGSIIFLPKISMML